MSPARWWNHNIHYHRLVLERVPAGARDALDIGCGEGMLARRLRQSVPRVVGIDPDEASIARAEQDGARVEFLRGEFLGHPFEPASFEMVVAVASLHHMDATRALLRMRELLRPGGTLVVIGLARATVRDIPYEAAGALVHRVHSTTKRYLEDRSPKHWPPPETYASMRTLARELLPGAGFRRHALWRYSIVWSKPR